jgi:hypothetical protein
MVIRVGVKSGEVCVRARMTLRAGFNALFAENTRLGVINWEDVMRSVTIGALSRRPMAQIRQLPMEAHQVLFGKLSMTVAAAPGKRFTKPNCLRIAKVVSPMTGRADWAFGRRATRRYPARVLVLTLRLPTVNTRLQSLLNK